MPTFELVSHALCPYVQRAAIVLAEKAVPFTRSWIDLAAKPAWFTAISPLGKVPLLRVDGRHVLFESAAICDYLDETIAPRLHPADPLRRAAHRAWIEVASAALNDLAGLYNAADEPAFARKAAELRARLERLEATLDPAGPYFAGERFSLVDAAFAPVFRYVDVLDRFLDPAPCAGLPRVQAWRQALADRPAVRSAVAEDYPDRLEAFLATRGSHLARLIPPRAESSPGRGR